MAEKKRKRAKTSLTSDESFEEPSVSSQKSAAESTDPKCIIRRSDGSMCEPLNFGLEEIQRQQSEELSSESLEDFRDPVHYTGGQQTDTEEEISVAGESHLLNAMKIHKEAMQKQFTVTDEGHGDQQTSLESINTTLNITAVESGNQHPLHEFSNLKHKLEQESSEHTIEISDIFKLLPDQERRHRTVLTKGVAGIGKSFSVRKFILDWAKGSANQDFDLVFSLAFKELNLSTYIKSLHQLLTEFHPAVHDLKDPGDIVKAKVLVILDGLDESRLQLDFENKPVSSVSEVTSVGNLLTNLIQGNLLPKAKLWITSRPAAANQIPAEFVGLVTEIRGFTDPQKEEYFRKRFSHDMNLADRIISHIRSSQTLDIMCQIPIFCWISAVLFQEIFGEAKEAETPQTLTEMMAHFLFTQTKRRSRKYDEKTDENKERFLRMHREFLLKLGKLAFVQLQNNNLIFYDEDLEECGIDVKEATICSGFCTAVLREEQVFSQKKVFFFVHLTVQEFFAALFVYDCFINNNTTELGNFLNLKDKDHTLLDLVKMTVDKVLEKKNGHLDFFLRFLLGLMVEPNRRVLQGLLTSPEPSQDINKKILTHLKAIKRKALSPDSCINLFQTMVEMRDNKVKNEIQEYLKSPDRLKTELTPLHCSALAYMLLVSSDELDVLDLKSYNTSDEGRRRLIPAVRSSRKAVLADCKVTPELVEHLGFTLKHTHSALRDLDLSNNDLKDSGVALLCNGLPSQCCRLETLRLSGCQVTAEGCAFLASALQSNASHLIELDLSYNHPGDSGEELLTELKNNPKYKLSILNIDHGGSHRMNPGFKKYACELTLDPNTADKNLLLSEENRKVTRLGDEQPNPKYKGTTNQVLCQQGLDGRWYWEVEVFGPLSVGVTYRGADEKKKTEKLKMGYNDKSWCLVCSSDGNYVLHNNEKVDVSPLGWRSSRVGVYLDWPAGTLSFYRVSSESRTRLHTYKTTFTELLYPAVELEDTRSSAFFCQLI